MLEESYWNLFLLFYHGKFDPKFLSEKQEVTKNPLLDSYLQKRDHHWKIFPYWLWSPEQIETVNLPSGNTILMTSTPAQRMVFCTLIHALNQIYSPASLFSLFLQLFYMCSKKVIIRPFFFVLLPWEDCPLFPVGKTESDTKSLQRRGNPLLDNYLQKRHPYWKILP